MPRSRRDRRTSPPSLARRLVVGLAVGSSMAPQFGCGREFFRQWADQDVSEAVFEKSRDPRFRLDEFAIEPPALSRFAQPYDIDRPPAPPDDRAAEALSPTPQWPHHRLLMPQEGTGYQDLLAQGPRYEQPPSVESPVVPAPDIIPAQPDELPQPGVPEPEAPSPFNPGGNFGTNPGGLTPNPVPAGLGQPAETTPPQARSQPKDPGVLLTAFQAPGSPATTPAEGSLPAVAPNAVQTAPGNANDQPQVPPGGRLLDPDVEGDPDGRIEANTPFTPRNEVNRGRQLEARAESSSFASILTQGALDFNEAQASGFPGDSRPYVVGPAQALQLALINSRAYQYRLEQIYIQSLAVTLARFAFTPQLYAGVSPSTAPPGGFPNNPVSAFNYRTKETLGGQVSTLNLGTAAGVGKLFSFGGRLAAGFANQTLFNFLSTNPRQPTVTSFLPLTFAQPFLRGGGRAFTLEPLTQAERNLVYEVRDFARFRQQIIPSILTQNQALSNAGPTDPNPGFLNILVQLQTVENNRRNVAAFDRVFSLYREYVKNSAASGISQVQVDQVAQQLQNSRSQLLSSEASYKSLNDQFKIQLGLPPDLPMILDRSTTSDFRQVFSNIDLWFASPDHDPSQLDGIIGALPRLESIVIDGRELFRYVPDPEGQVKLTQIFADPDRQQEFLLAAERVALENRLDLMNSRAQLYDTWRQLAVTANQLKGVFNISVSNQITTAATSTNPFAFLDQAKQFNLSLNTELPLIRVAERNNYRQATITYQRQQRVLMQAEDNIKLTVRQQIYNLINLAETFEIQKTNLLVTVRQRDTSIQQIIAPPASASTGGNDAGQATQTLNLITSISATLSVQNSLLNNWVQYQTQRLSLYRDLGLMPYDEWEAYYEFFPANSGAAVNDKSPAGGGGAAVPGEAGPAS